MCEPTCVSVVRSIAVTLGCGVGVDQGGEEYCNKVDEPPKEVSKRIETPWTGLKNLAIPAHVDHDGFLVSVAGLPFDLTVEENQRLSKDVRSAISRFFLDKVSSIVRVFYDSRVVCDKK